MTESAKRLGNTNIIFAIMKPLGSLHWKMLERKCLSVNNVYESGST
jgi:hypothetical protein